MISKTYKMVSQDYMENIKNELNISIAYIMVKGLFFKTWSRHKGSIVDVWSNIHMQLSALRGNMVQKCMD